MGVSFKGIATRTDENTILNGLIRTYEKWNHKFEAEFDAEHFFEVLINRKPDNNIVDIYSTSSGTICILSLDLFEILSKHDLSTNFDFVYFDISETSMSHRFALFSSGKEGLCMNVWDKGSSKQISGDNFLNITNEEDIFLNVFPRTINDYLPKSFNDIDLSTKIKRYRLITKTEKEPEKTKESIHKKRTVWDRLFG
jgi:hypothetical protein